MKLSLMKILFISAIFIAFFNVGNCEEEFAKKYDKDLTEIQQEISKKLNAPGDILYVKFPDKSVWVKGYGLSCLDKEKHESIDVKMKFRIASVTKTFIGTSVLQLVKQDKFTLNDTIEKLIPRLIEYGNLITVRMLLNHSSSIHLLCNK
ncbi:MAG: serine hydrolase domain-containing protein [Desulfobulbus sp.]